MSLSIHGAAEFCILGPREVGLQPAPVPEKGPLNRLLLVVRNRVLLPLVSFRPLHCTEPLISELGGAAEEGPPASEKNQGQWHGNNPVDPKLVGKVPRVVGVREEGGAEESLREVEGVRKCGRLLSATDFTAGRLVAEGRSGGFGVLGPASYRNKGGRQKHHGEESDGLDDGIIRAG